jgi:phage tail-like protein
MERGLTHDPEFEKWANMVHAYAGDAAMDLANYKKELTLEMMNEKGHVVFRYFLHAAWVSEFTALPELNSNANALAIESLKIELEGWNRDPDTKEPKESDAVPAAG